MKISVTRGEVPIRSVIVRAHLEGREGPPARIYSVTISTPLDKHPIVTLGSTITPADGLGHRVELYRARRAAGEFNPSVVDLVPDRGGERIALEAGLFEIEWNRWAVTLLAIAPALLGSGHVVDSWEEFAHGPDYVAPQNEGGYPG